jgi:chemotaxis protein MotB
MGKMKRHRRRRVRIREASHTDDYWISYADLLASLLLCFILFLLLSNFSNQQAVSEKDKIIQAQVGVKKSIIVELEQAFAEEKLLNVDQKTGLVTFGDNILFDRNSAQIKPEGKKLLETFIPKYVEILLSEEFKDEVDQIVIEGHTDNTGEYLYNLKLSQTRASAVVEMIYGTDFPNFLYKEELKKVITANGRANSEPLQDAAKSRRVVFKFRLKDEDALKKIGQKIK